MLLSLCIDNFALIDHLELDFGQGLNVLTGETGAGKSIILDAIDTVLGGKPPGRAVRTGAEKATIEAHFQMRPTLLEWCEQAEIDVDDDALICSREIGGSGQRNRNRINGVLVNKQQMQSLRDRLVEITAQGQTVQLGNPALQRDWLDSFGGTAIFKQRAVVAKAFEVAQQAKKALEERLKLESQRQQQLDLFEYQLAELKEAQLTEPDEMEQLENEQQRLSHTVDLQQQSYTIYQMLYDNETGNTPPCSELLGDAERILQNMAEIDRELQPIADAVTNALAQVESAGKDINSYGKSLEADPQRLDEVQERINVLKQILRKYAPTLEEAINLRDSLQAQVDELTGNGQSLEELEADVEKCQTELADACAVLTNLRKVEAHKLEKQLVDELKPLAMDKVQFQVGITPITPGTYGGDKITYLFSPNPGEPLQPLVDVASGGEMSRFLLALQACFSQVDGVGTLVFDEIDAGVSGRVANSIAEKLHHLSHHQQVLCVTHQPIIAAMADAHYRVRKEVIGENGKPVKRASAKDDSLRTVVRLEPLDMDERRLELATIAAGDVVKDEDGSAKATFDFADSLLAQAEKLRASRGRVVAAAKTKKTKAKPAAAKTAKTATKTIAKRKAKAK
ncbi:DNA repair protein RecN [filamentous cyanobacterium LEGE 11480]|uniref:DNA repair protein RecN n=1 Tax=Romeriopsis navalis LEGE 11480 TaxID=2777977 RepID=A0A928Z690_9CYAN|nr:DNA repair protein RecN [Romeriopsis navalis]MBE9032015.1 DNA repair protein RecN [Romeriopsis navalis LEGE 11480]